MVLRLILLGALINISIGESQGRASDTLPYRSRLSGKSQSKSPLYRSQLKNRQRSRESSVNPLLVNMQSQLAFQFNKDITIPPNVAVMTFINGSQSTRSGQCIFRACPASNRSVPTYTYVYAREVAPVKLAAPLFSGCEVRLKQEHAEPRIIGAGTKLVAVRREVEDQQLPICFTTEFFAGSCAKPGTGSISVRFITYYLDSENVESIRCGSAYNNLTLDYLRQHFGDGNIELLGALIERIE